MKTKISALIEASMNRIEEFDRQRHNASVMSDAEGGAEIACTLEEAGVVETARGNYEPRWKASGMRKMTPAEIRKRKLDNKKNKAKNARYQKMYRAANKQRIKMADMKRKKFYKTHKPKAKKAGYTYNYSTGE